MKIVTRLPLQILFSEDYTIEFSRRKTLAENDLKKLLKSGLVQFVTASVGRAITWHDKTRCYEFWKSEVKPHLMPESSKIDVSFFPGGYAYLASKWETDDGESVVVLEVHH